MSDWIDAGPAGDSPNADAKGCLIAIVFFGILMVAAFLAYIFLF